jgi:hypothetical protein
MLTVCGAVGPTTLRLCIPNGMHLCCVSEICATRAAGGQLDTEALQRAKTPEGTSAAAAVDAVAGVVREKMALRRGVK